MWSVFLSPANAAQQEEMTAELWERGTAGIMDSADGFRAYFEDEQTARKAALDLASNPTDVREEPAPELLPENCEDWEPVYAGTRFVIVPTKRRGEFDFGARLVLEVNAAMAFGSGRHETTQLCLEALELYLKPGNTVLDVGCGSGILALAAQKLGAGNVIACDIQEDAIRTAREHFSGSLVQGSADCVSDGFADILLANVSARINDRIAADLRRVLKPNGLLITSGFIADNVPRSFHPSNEMQRGEWLCWICTADGIRPLETVGDANVHSLNWY
jgi:ribosomal protein L11 methyltransferase